MNCELNWLIDQLAFRRRVEGSKGRRVELSNYLITIFFFLFSIYLSRAHESRTCGKHTNYLITIFFFLFSIYLSRAHESRTCGKHTNYLITIFFFLFSIFLPRGRFDEHDLLIPYKRDNRLKRSCVADEWNSEACCY
jgi:hypothetical protein